MVQAEQVVAHRCQGRGERVATLGYLEGEVDGGVEGGADGRRRWEGSTVLVVERIKVPPAMAMLGGEGGKDGCISVGGVGEAMAV